MNGQTVSAESVTRTLRTRVITKHQRLLKFRYKNHHQPPEETPTLNWLKESGKAVNEDFDAVDEGVGGVGDEERRTRGPWIMVRNRLGGLEWGGKPSSEHGGLGEGCLHGR